MYLHIIVIIMQQKCWADRKPIPLFKYIIQHKGHEDDTDKNVDTIPLPPLNLQKNKGNCARGRTHVAFSSRAWL